MTIRICVLTIFVFFCVLPLFAQEIITPIPDSKLTLSARIDSLLAPIVNNGASIGIDIQDVSNDSLLYAKYANAYMTPASIQKLFTTSVCLLKLGEDYQYKTPVMYTGKMKGHKIKGDLIIAGSGDPSMSDRFYQGDAETVFINWADSLLAHHIHRIKGDIVILDTLFQVKSWGAGWNWDDLAYDYTAERTSFIFNENRGYLVLIGTEDGQSPAMIMKPENIEIPVQNDVVTDSNITKDSVQLTSMMDGKGIRLTGSLKPNHQDEEFFAIPNPEVVSGKILHSILMQKGIKCKGKVRVIHSMQELKHPKMTLIFEHASPTLAKITRFTNKQSLNLASEALLLTLGRTDKNSINILKYELQSMNINPDSIYIADGSGLSRYNMCTASQCSKLLVYMAGKPEFSTFLASLPMAGMDGTLSKRMKAIPTIGKIFAKTGSMRYVRNLSGYAMNRNHTLFAITILINDYKNDEEMTKIQDAICSLIAETDF